MDVNTLVAVMTYIAQNVPIVGPYLPTALAILSTVIMVGSLIALKLKAPVPGSSSLYNVFYEFIQWCSLAKGQAVSLTSPKVNGLVAGPYALSAAAQSTASVPVPEPTPLPPGTIPIGTVPTLPKGPTS